MGNIAVAGTGTAHLNIFATDGAEFRGAGWELLVALLLSLILDTTQPVVLLHEWV